ncbi:MAG: Verru_Chthon cassette protein C [bacterium]
MSLDTDYQKPRCTSHAFSILEVLVATSVLMIIAVVLIGMVDAVRKLNSQTTLKIAAYREAQRAMEVLSSAISQATLNTYLDYVDSGGNYRFRSGGNATTFVPVSYKRTSELRFRSGNLPEVATANRPSHAVFFQAPLGLVSSNSYKGLENLLNSVGFYIEFRDDSDSRPDYFNNLSNPKPTVRRYRLMQAVQPSDQLTIYNYTAANPGLKSSDAGGTTWLTDTLGANKYVIADNIIAMVILPMLGAADQTGSYTAASLAKNYTYDTTATDSDAVVNPYSQLPPLVALTLVAVDERSFARFQGDSGSPRDLGLGSLFQSVGDLKNPSNPGYAKDLETLKSTLTQNRIDYRVFTLVLPINAARWSKNQKN